MLQRRSFLVGAWLTVTTLSLIHSTLVQDTSLASSQVEHLLYIVSIRVVYVVMSSWKRICRETSSATRLGILKVVRVWRLLNEIDVVAFNISFQVLFLCKSNNNNTRQMRISKYSHGHHEMSVYVLIKRCLMKSMLVGSTKMANA